MRDGIQGIADAEISLIEPLLVAGVLLSELADVCHGLHGLHGVFTGSGLAGEHHRAAAIVHGVGHIGNLGTGGAGVLNHGFQHFRCGNHSLAQHPAGGGQTLLDGRHFHEGNFHAQVAAGNHDTVCISLLEDTKEAATKSTSF